ncbi:conserved hypothetical protein [Verticillium alfalfae VaMs.102]|uniref:Histidine acid phosphatase family protein n=1 Tax=Verticillium alfalfae (strain VaMs.102 / ATCC MYA-4576 / FGSC 10136) TaxID=526221 RepID=C9SFA9_VERA1|nr:conserved hypothetical protein [Verticillium alfalfae VaMs.102]EEY17895.1 conserved hypothetical protein [Verticillium alfalfae VaMs.102]
MALWSKTGPILGALAVVGSTVSAQSMDVSWHAPAKSQVNANFTEVLNGEGKWGFIYDTSETPIDKYGTYNWCNMPHVRKTEYVRPSDDFELKYVELVSQVLGILYLTKRLILCQIHRHHKRTPYSSNAFPVESYQWNCDEQGLFYFGERLDGSNSAAKTYWKVYISPVNPFVPAGWIGTCQFPQITAQGLDDSYVHGVDLFGVYHDLLGFLPSRNDPSWHEKVQYRVTNNQITSQVAGLLIKGMYDTTSPQGLNIQASGVDSLEPQYSCPAGSSLFSRIKSGSNPAWANHLRAAAPLYSALDTISGVPASNAGFHNSFDPYYDNLSARQCHDKPLPCKLVNGRNDTSACISQTQADTVFRIGHWEYSQIYRDSPDSLAASAATYGVWAAELAGHLRAAAAGDGAANAPIYRHNVAHDGSVSRLLSLLQVNHMGLAPAWAPRRPWRRNAPARRANDARDNVARLGVLFVDALVLGGVLFVRRLEELERAHVDGAVREHADQAHGDAAVGGAEAACEPHLLGRVNDESVACQAALDSGCLKSARLSGGCGTRRIERGVGHT